MLKQCLENKGEELPRGCILLVAHIFSFSSKLSTIFFYNFMKLTLQMERKTFFAMMT